MSDFQVAPVRLNWDPEQGRLVESGRTDKQVADLGASAIHHSDLAERDALLAGSSERLPPALVEALGESRARRAGAVLTLPVFHAVTDTSTKAFDESWRVLGANGNDAILTPAQGILGRLRAMDDPLEASVIRDEGIVERPDHDRAREDRPVEDTGGTLYVSSAEDITAARQAYDAVHGTPPSAEEAAESQRMLDEWKVQAAAHDVILDAQLEQWVEDHEPDDK